jgi:putative addiction module component (TIGR02574 family)
MAAQANRVLSQALRLPDKERARIAATLIESLDAEIDAEVEKKWRAEVARRIEELDAGRVKTVPWTEARKRIFRQRIFRRRAR